MAFKKYARRSSKYNSRKIENDGIKFASKKEAKRWQELKILETAGEIENLQRQVKFLLIPAQYEPDTIDYSKSKRGRKVKGKLLEHEAAYYADFVYQKDGETVVEDVKGYREGGAYSIFVLKRKMMLFMHQIQIKEI